MKKDYLDCNLDSISHLKEKTIIMTADGISYSLAKEAALKTKETSYKNKN